MLTERVEVVAVVDHCASTLVGNLRGVVVFAVDGIENRARVVVGYEEERGAVSRAECDAIDGANDACNGRGDNQAIAVEIGRESRDGIVTAASVIVAV